MRLSPYLDSSFMFIPRSFPNVPAIIPKEKINDMDDLYHIVGVLEKGEENC